MKQPKKKFSNNTMNGNSGTDKCFRFLSSQHQERKPLFNVCLINVDFIELYIVTGKTEVNTGCLKLIIQLLKVTFRGIQHQFSQTEYEQSLDRPISVNSLNNQ